MFEPYAVIVVRLNHTLRELPGGVWELLRRGVLPDDSPGCHFRRLAQNKQLRRADKCGCAVYIETLMADFPSISI